MAASHVRNSNDGRAPGTGIENLQSTVHQLRERMDRLTLVCSAMWEMIREHTNLTEDDLMAKIQQLDLADGAADGKIKRMPVECGQCGRTISLRHNACLFCGTERPGAGAFDAAM